MFFIQDKYINLVSEFKLERSVAEETKAFCAGFWKVCIVNLALCIIYSVLGVLLGGGYSL